MADPNLVDFYGRVARIEKARANGYGHEAAGTLGRKFFQRPETKRRPLLRSLLFAGLCVFTMKAMIYDFVGESSYNDRVAQLIEGEGFDRLGGWLMQADPVTLWFSERIDTLRGRMV